MDVVIIGLVVFVIAVVTILVAHSRAKKAKIEQIKLPYKMLGEDFARVGWPAWGYGAHLLPGQDDRIQRAIRSKAMKLISYDKETHTAVVCGERGKHYEITPQGCSCPDFAERQLPCKHMYFAAMEIE